MRKYELASAAFVIAMVAARTSAAAPACEWELNNGEERSIVLNEGDTVVVAVTTPARGEMSAPDGWETRFQAQNACPGFPEGCGVWTATKVVTTAHAPGDHDDNGPAMFTVEGAGCANNGQAFNLTVEPAEPMVTPDPNAAKITQSEWDEVKSRPGSASREGGRYDLSGALLLTPNLPTTTSVGVGAELAFGAIVAGAFKMALALDYQRVGIPIEEQLHPAVMAGSEDQWAAKIRLAWSPDLAWWIHMDLGGEFGYNGSHYSTTFVRQENDGNVEHVMQRTQHSPVLGPYVRAGLCPAEEFCFIGQFTSEVTFNRSRTIGEGATDDNGEFTTPESGHVQVNPTFGLGAAVYF